MDICNSNPSQRCDKHVFDLTKLMTKQYCFCCGCDNVDKYELSVYYQPKYKEFARGEKCCYGTGIINLCKKECCRELIKEVEQLGVGGYDRWDILDDILEAINGLKL